MGIAERLEENVWLPADEIIQRRKNENAGEAIRETGIQRDVLKRSAEAELVCAVHECGGFDYLDMVLGARRIEQPGLAEADHARYLKGAARVRNKSIERRANWKRISYEPGLPTNCHPAARD